MYFYKKKIVTNVLTSFCYIDQNVQLFQIFSDPSSADESKYAIFIYTGANNYTPLPGTMTLEQVNDKFWNVNKPLEMFYARQKKSVESPAKKGIEK